MGVLDEAIRQHLELKRAHGASEDELERQEAEALGPARRDPVSGEGTGDAAAEAPGEAAPSPSSAPDRGTSEPAPRPDASTSEPPEADEVTAAEALEPSAPPDEPAGPVDATAGIAGPGRVFDVEELGPPEDQPLGRRGSESFAPPEEEEILADEEMLDAEEEAEEELAEELASGGDALSGTGESAPGLAAEDPLEEDAVEEEALEGDDLAAEELRADALEEDDLEGPPLDPSPAAGDRPAPEETGLHSAPPLAEAETDEYEVQDELLEEAPAVEGELVEEELLEEGDLLDEEEEGELLPEEVGPEEAGGPASAPLGAEDETAVHGLGVEDDEDDLDAEVPGDGPQGHGPAGDLGAEEEDVLEETPDFLEETPEHERLWFEQKPPRDFDLDR